MAEERPPWLDDIRSLARSLSALEQRVRQLEDGTSHAPVALADEVRADDGPAPDEDPPHGDDASQALIEGIQKAPAHVGRLLLVLGGGYLLRALAGIEQVPAVAGAAAGLAYGCSWLLLADRSGRAGDAYTAAWHGVAAAAIVFPLLWETSARFGIVSFVVAGVLLGLLTLLAFWIAVRRGVPLLASLFAGAAGVCGLASMISAGAASVPVATALFALGLAGLRVGRRHGMPLPMIVSAAAADAAALVLAIGAVRGSGAPASTAIVLLVLLVVGYVLASAAETLAGRRRLDRFDWTQTACVLVLGFGGAMFVASKTGTFEVILGIGAVVLAVGLYLLAFTVVDRERRRGFTYLTTIAIILVLSASASLLPRPVLPWALLAMATAVTARRFGRVTLGTHAGIYALAATLGSGALRDVPGWWTGLAGALPADPAPWLAVAALLVVGAVRVFSTREATARTGDATRALILVVLVAVVGGLALRTSLLLVPPALQDSGNVGWLAAARTVVLALLTLACAGFGRRTGYRTLGWCAPVLLGIGALKLVFEDLAAGQAVSLALSFSAFGAALILTQRLLRRRSPEA